MKIKLKTIFYHENSLHLCNKNFPTESLCFHFFLWFVWRLELTWRSDMLPSRSMGSWFYAAHSYSYFLFSSIDSMQTHENSVVFSNYWLHSWSNCNSAHSQTCLAAHGPRTVSASLHCCTGSAPVERVFSQTGKVLHVDRCCPKTLFFGRPCLVYFYLNMKFKTNQIVSVIEKVILIVIITILGKPFN